MSSSSASRKTFFSRSFQRWLRFQQIMNRKRWFELDRERNGPITIFDFTSVNSNGNDDSDMEDVIPFNTAKASIISSSKTTTQEEGTSTSSSSFDRAMAVRAASNKMGLNNSTWKIVDDSFIGGYSTSSIQIIDNDDDKEDNESSESDSQCQEDSNKQKEEYDDDDDNDAMKKSSSSLASSSSSPLSFIRWEGIIDSTVDDEMSTKRGIQRSGFANVRSPRLDGGGTSGGMFMSWLGGSYHSLTGGLDLGGRYNGLEIVCRQPYAEYSSRLYTVNLIVESMIPDDMYQCVLHVPESSPSSTSSSSSSTRTTIKEPIHKFPYLSTLDDIPSSTNNASGVMYHSDGTTETTEDDEEEEDEKLVDEQLLDNGFQKVVVLFRHFMVSSGSGKLRKSQRLLDNRVIIQSIGLTVGSADHLNGPFALDIARIRAINYDGTGIIGQVD